MGRKDMWPRAHHGKIFTSSHFICQSFGFCYAQNSVSLSLSNTHTHTVSYTQKYTLPSLVRKCQDHVFFSNFSEFNLELLVWRTLSASHTHTHTHTIIKETAISCWLSVCCWNHILMLVLLQYNFFWNTVEGRGGRGGLWPAMETVFLTSVFVSLLAVHSSDVSRTGRFNAPLASPAVVAFSQHLQSCFLPLFPPYCRARWFEVCIMFR